MSVIRYVAANLIAGVLRPIVWAAFVVFAIWFVVTVPARVWVLYVDPRASGGTIAVLEWGTGVLLGSGLLFWRLLPSIWRMRRLGRSPGRVRRGA